MVVKIIPCAPLIIGTTVIFMFCKVMYLSFCSSSTSLCQTLNLPLPLYGMVPPLSIHSNSDWVIYYGFLLSMIVSDLCLTAFVWLGQGHLYNSHRNTASTQSYITLLGISFLQWLRK